MIFSITGQTNNREEQRKQSNYLNQSDNNMCPASLPARIRSCRIQSCKLHRVTIGIAVTAALLFSIFSSIDCKFVRVDVGFTPDNAIYRSNKFGLGLWSMEDPNLPQKCLMIDASRRIGSVTRRDIYYSSSFFNGDIIWGTARIIALSGIFFGLVDVMITWKLIFLIETSKNRLKETILYLSILSFVCEGVKLGLFFSTEPCSSQLWEQNSTVGTNMVGAIERFEADQCYMDRSTYSSLSALACYLFLIICLIASQVKPDYTHQIIRQQRTGGIGMSFDEVSVPSCLGSIGLSVSNHQTPSNIYRFSFDSQS